MSGNLFVLPKQVPIESGAVVPGGKLYFFQSATTTPQNTYTDIELTTPHAHPVVADADGVFDPIYFDSTLPNYRVRLTDDDDVQLYQVDDVPSSQAGQSLTLESTAPYIDLIESDATDNNKVWRLQVNSEQLALQVGNDALSSFTDVLTVERTANAVDTIDLKPTSLRHNNSPILTKYTAFSFSPTFGGFSSPPTGTIRYIIQGNVVHVWIQVGQGTSNGVTFTITNWPEALRTVYGQLIPIVGLVDNGGNSSWGSIQIVNSATAVLYYNEIETGWTASGAKGFDTSSGSFVSFSYPLLFV
jgi:hypothetical protein